ncbi:MULTISPECIES: Cro/CI family transcriptional regulator [unclassified Pseudoalteromonas]|uniref:Cro/CI family transcriptional regulator n=1 Tax=unclassified Pseudoalteromonas TaxID=194690 RepID=UPI00110AE32D|nr:MULTISPECIES: Cro/CI family transcriptional regulator [unclassified Pseudoalteromonas]MCP4588364.1 Cro/Cl family transcriptional regulator [Pseudoalteromonas sp.]TMO16758.1 Cro/Cl family transcriptional regulator [Pseudoalteromonas sp. S326]
MKTTDAVAHFGSNIKLANAFNPPLTKGAITPWVKSGLIPRGRACELELLTGGKLKVDFSVYSDDEPQTAA